MIRVDLLDRLAANYRLLANSGMNLGLCMRHLLPSGSPFSGAVPRSWQPLTVIRGWKSSRFATDVIEGLSFGDQLLNGFEFADDLLSSEPYSVLRKGFI